MNTKKIKNLIEILKESDLQSLAYKDQDFEIELSMPTSQAPVVMASQPNQITIEPEVSVVDDAKAFKSLLVGVFYSKPSPDSQPYVSVGQSVNEGDVICIIEAMKVMNEIIAPKSGVIAEILVNDGEAVAFDQTLFTIK